MNSIDLPDKKFYDALNEYVSLRDNVLLYMYNLMGITKKYLEDNEN